MRAGYLPDSRGYGNFLPRPEAAVAAALGSGWVFHLSVAKGGDHRRVKTGKRRRQSRVRMYPYAEVLDAGASGYDSRGSGIGSGGRAAS